MSKASPTETDAVTRQMDGNLFGQEHITGGDELPSLSQSACNSGLTANHSNFTLNQDLK